MPEVFPMSQATSVLLSDGWHDLTAGSLGVVMDPSFTDPFTGTLVTPGEPWAAFTDATGNAYAFPMRCMLAVKIPASLIAPTAAQ